MATENPSKTDTSHAGQQEAIRAGQKRILDESEHRKQRPSPGFWDNHSSPIPLTCDAIRELDDRNNRNCLDRFPNHIPQAQVTFKEHAEVDLKRFSRKGGPDLQSLVGYPNMAEIGSESEVTPISSTPSNPRGPTWKKGPTGRTRRSKRAVADTISSYDPEFAQELENAFLYSPNARAPIPGNLHDVKERLKLRRDSVSFTEDEFQRLREAQDKINKNQNEDAALAKVFQTFLGSSKESTIEYGFHKVFGHLAPFNDLADPKPDYYVGASFKKVHATVRADLYKFIIPANPSSNQSEGPIAANFFCEVKGPNGIAEKCLKQLVHALGVGARAMHKLQNYRQDNPEFDGNAYTFGATYTSGGTPLFTLFAMHPSPPLRGETEPQYYTTHIKSYTIFEDVETFRTGVTAFRNLRDLAGETRDTLISHAEAALEQPTPSASSQSDGTLSSPPASVAVTETQAPANLRYELRARRR